MVNTKKLPDVLIWFFIGIVVFFMAYPFESFSGSIPGHALGIAGTVMMFLALIYPYRKRILKKKEQTEPSHAPCLFWLGRRQPRGDSLRAQTRQHRRSLDIYRHASGGAKWHCR